MIQSNYILSWEDIKSIYNKLNIQRSRFGLSQVSIPDYQNDYATIVQISNLKNDVEALKTNSWVGNIANTNLTLPVVGELIRPLPYNTIDNTIDKISEVCIHFSANFSANFTANFTANFSNDFSFDNFDDFDNFDSFDSNDFSHDGSDFSNDFSHDGSNFSNDFGFNGFDKFDFSDDESRCTGW